MITGATSVSGREAVLSAVGGHPYARLTTDGDGPVAGFRLGETTVWTGPGPWGPVACAMGDPDRAAGLFAALASAGELGGAAWLHLPRVPVAALAHHLSVVRHDHWDFRWAVSPPPVQAGEDRVVQLTDADHDAIHALLDDAFPATTTRPGDPRVARWFGIWTAGRLVACGADRSRGGVGFLAGLTVATDAQGQGLGSALTAAMTRRLFADYDAVALGVMADHDRTIRLYERLGFTGTLTRTSVALA